MRTNAKIALLLAVFGVVGWLTACSDLDGPDSADVVMEIRSITSTPITSVPSTADPTSCVFTITQWTMSVFNLPKNELAITSPYNDVQLDYIEISYDWNNAAITTPTWISPMGGVIPANGAASVSFYPIAADELDPAMAGNAAGISIRLVGHTGAGTGEEVVATSAAQLATNSCQLQPIVGGCCSGGTCTLLRASDCIGGGGTYLGDNTTCALNPCGGP